MTNFGGAARDIAVGFSIGSRGYIGTGGNAQTNGWWWNETTFKQDFWEYTPEPCSTSSVAECDIFIPDVFSPNDDGQNDVLYVRTNCIKEMTFKIFDRWGKKIFETNDLNTGWNGTFKNTPLDPAVFVYCLEATLVSDKKVTRKGNLTLLR